MKWKLGIALLVAVLGTQALAKMVNSPAVVVGNSDGLYLHFLHADSSKAKPVQLTSGKSRFVFSIADDDTLYYTVESPYVGLGRMLKSGSILDTLDFSTLKNNATGLNFAWSDYSGVELSNGIANRKALLLKANGPRLHVIRPLDPDAVFDAENAFFDMDPSSLGYEYLTYRQVLDSYNKAVILYRNGTETGVGILQASVSYEDATYSLIMKGDKVLESLTDVEGLASDRQNHIYVYDRAKTTLHYVDVNGTEATDVPYSLNLGVVDTIWAAEAFTGYVGSVYSQEYFWMDNAGVHWIANFDKGQIKTIFSGNNSLDFGLALERKQWVPEGRLPRKAQVISDKSIRWTHPASNGTDALYYGIEDTGAYGGLTGDDAYYIYNAPAVPIDNDYLIDTVVATVWEQTTKQTIYDTVAITIRASNPNGTSFNTSTTIGTVSEGMKYSMDILNLAVDKGDDISMTYRISEEIEPSALGTVVCGDPGAAISSAEYKIPMSFYASGKRTVDAVAVYLNTDAFGTLSAILYYSKDGGVTYQTASEQPTSLELGGSGDMGFMELALTKPLYLDTNYTYMVKVTQADGYLCTKGGSAYAQIREYSHHAIIPDLQLTNDGVGNFRVAGTVGKDTLVRNGTQLGVYLYVTISDGLTSTTSKQYLLYQRINKAPQIAKLGIRDTVTFRVPWKNYSMDEFMTRSLNIQQVPLENLDDGISYDSLKFEFRWKDSTQLSHFSNCGTTAIKGEWSFDDNANRTILLSGCPDSGLAGLFEIEMRLRDSDGTDIGGRDSSDWLPLQLFFNAEPQYSGTLPVDTLKAGASSQFVGTYSDADGVNSNRLRLYSIDTLSRQVATDSGEIATSRFLGIQFQIDSTGNAVKFFVRASFPGHELMAAFAPVNSTTGSATTSGSYVKYQKIGFFRFGEWLALDVPDSINLVKGSTYHMYIASMDSAFTYRPGKPVAASTRFSTANDMEMLVYQPDNLSSGPDFYLIGNSQEVPWASGNAADGKYSVTFSPAKENAGTHQLWMVLGDGFVETVDSVHVVVEVDEPGEKPDFGDFTVDVAGWAAQLGEINLGGSTDKLAYVHVSGPSIDSTWRALSKVSLWNLLPGTYSVLYYMVDSLSSDTLATWESSFVVDSMRVDMDSARWNLGNLPGVAVADLPGDAEVYVWNDTLSVGAYWQYQNRDMLDTMQIGKAFWLFSDSAIHWTPGNNRPDSARWDLLAGKTGWNMVSNPYPWPLDVSQRVVGSDTLVFWAWDALRADYAPVSILQPYAGAWVHVDSTLHMDLAKEFVKENDENLVLAKSLAKPTTGWSLNLRLKSGDLSDAYNVIGVAAENDRWVAPPGKLGKFVDLSIRSGNALLARDIRNGSDSSLYWNLSLGADGERPARVSADGLESLHAQGLRAWLYHKGGYTELTENSSVPIVLSKANSSAALVVMASSVVPAVVQPPILKSARQNSGLQLSWSWTGLSEKAYVEVVDLRGKILWRSAVEMGNGHNELFVPMARSLGSPVFVRLRTSAGNSVRGAM